MSAASQALRSFVNAYTCNILQITTVVMLEYMQCRQQSCQLLPNGRLIQISYTVKNAGVWKPSNRRKMSTWQRISHWMQFLQTLLSFCHRRKLQAVTFNTSFDQLSSIVWYIIHV